MKLFSKPYLPLTFITGILLLVIALFLFRQPPPPPPLPAPPLVLPTPSLSMLATAPDWKALDVFQNSIRRDEFERLLTTVFTTGEAWKNHIEIGDTEARIQTGISPTAPEFVLRFAESETSPTRDWRGAAEIPLADPLKPLTGIHIAIDAGHIGGTWAKMEERWFVVGDGKPVQEGDMTLAVAKLLQPRLESLGARITLVRDSLEPVTDIRPDALMSLAQDAPAGASPRKLAERLFYRTAEIRARADRVNQVIKPDLVLCLHFNAEGWGDPNTPTLIDRTHLHLLLNGAYTDEEVGLADQRFAMLRKLLQRTHEEEVLVGATVAETFAAMTGLPPYLYPPESKSVRPVSGQPYLWVRNLLANRLYDCPVIFMEPYVMNSNIDHARIQAGDYEGLREIGGKMLPSIYQEYASALTEALRKHYTLARPPINPAQPAGQ